MIPADRVHPQALRDLQAYLRVELDAAISARKPMERRWMRIHEKYRAQPEQERKRFPFDGAANLVVPVLATDAETIFSRIMAMLFGPENLWTGRALRPDMIDFAARLQEFLRWAQKNELDLENVVADWLLELIKLGTGVLKTRYLREERLVYEYREAQGSGQILQQQRMIYTQDRPEVLHVPLFDFYVPPNTRDIPSAPWCAQRLNLSWAQLMNRARAGIYVNVDKVGRHYGTSRGSDMDRFLSQLELYQPTQDSLHECFEFWLPWDIDLDGRQEAIMCVYHRQSWELLRLDYNPFFNQEPPFEAAPYQRVEGRFYGIGLGEMLEGAQDEITAMHNQRIDNGTIGNAQVIVAIDDGTIRQDEPIFPGRVLLVRNVDNVKPFSLGSPMSSTIPNEQMTLQYAKSRSGVNDYISGSSDGTVNYASATTAVQQLREGEKRFDQVLREVRKCLGRVGTKVVELYQQFNQGGKPYYALGDRDGAMVAQILNFPLDLIRMGVAVEVTATSAQYNKEVEVRTNMIVMQQLTQYYTQLFQALMTAMNPQLPPPLQNIMLTAAMGGTTLMRRLLDSHGVQDADTLVPDLRQALTGGYNPLAQPQLGGAPMAPGPYAASGMGAPQGGAPGSLAQFAAAFGGGVGAPGAVPAAR